MSESGHEWGRHHRAYLRACDLRCKLAPRELAGRCGYVNISKLQRRRVSWREDRTHGNVLVPVAYLNAIGVDLCELARAVKLDLDAYEHAVAHRPPPREVVVYGRGALGVCVKKPIPADLSMDEAYAFAQHTADQNAAWDFHARLTWPRLVHVHFHKGTEPRVFTWPPRLDCHGDHVAFNAPLWY